MKISVQMSRSVDAERGKIFLGFALGGNDEASDDPDGRPELE